MQQAGENVLKVLWTDGNGNVVSEKELTAPEERFIHAGRMISAGLLSSCIAHEITSPNSYISLSASMLAEIWDDLKPALARLHAENGGLLFGRFPLPDLETLVPQMITGIAEGSGRISTTINRLSEFTSENDRHAGNIDINIAVREAVSFLRNYIHKHTGTFHLSPQEGLPPVCGNQQRLMQLLVNLIMNALQSLPGQRAGVTVETALDHDKKNIMILVRDEGKGMSEETLSRLTEPFFTTRVEEGGTGLGLFVSAQIIKEHRGVLEFFSSPGQGTTATIRLPVATGFGGNGSCE